AVRALCARALLLNAGRIIEDGKPADVLNRYQKIIMAREQAYEKSTTASVETTAVDESQPPLCYTYRHGNGSAEIIAAELSDAAHHRVEIVETGESLLMRLMVRSNRNIDQPVIGFLIRNRHGISAYGTKTEEQPIELGAVRRDELLEVVLS